MDANLFGEAIGFGLQAGGVLVFALASILVPASYMMNLYAHHSLPMRLFMGLLGACGTLAGLLASLSSSSFSFITILAGSVQSWIFLIIHGFLTGWKKAPFHTLFPLRAVKEAPTSIFTTPVSFLETPGMFAAAFPAYTEEEDAAKGKRYMMNDVPFTVQKGTVSEALLEQVRLAGSTESVSAWKNLVDVLSPAATLMLGRPQMEEIPSPPQ